MKNSSIFELIKNMEIIPLNEKNFNYFHKKLNKYFSKGSSYQEYFVPGYNDFTKDEFNFSKNKIKFQKGKVLKFKELIINSYNNKAIQVYFKGKKINLDELIINNNEDKPNLGIGDFKKNKKTRSYISNAWVLGPNEYPVEFGFYKKAFYILEEENGTKEFPWELIYIKLK